MKIRFYAEFLMIIFFITIVIWFYSGITARLVAQGGNVTQVDISVPDSNLYWFGLYGNASYSNPETSVSLGGTATVENFNPGIIHCKGKEIYATTLASVDWSQVVPAQPSDVDSFLGLPSDSVYSGTSIFTAQKTFNISNHTMLLWSTTTRGAGVNYTQGILAQAGTLIIVSVQQGSTAFNGQAADYQMMLPVPYGTIQNYNFFLDSADIVACNDPPEFIQVTVPRIIQQNTPSQIIVDFMDPNSDPVTVTASRPADISIISPGRALINWTPSETSPGNLSFIITLTDIHGNTAQKTLNLSVGNINDPPVIEQVGDINGYLHERYIQYIRAYDPDAADNFSDNVTLEFGTSPHLSWIDITTYFNVTDQRFYGIINFTPLDSQKGSRNIKIIATDGTATDSRNITYTIGFCGDFDQTGEPVCDSLRESCASCVADCGKCPSDKRSSMALDVVKSDCYENYRTIIVFDLWDRASCPTQGLIINGREICGVVADADVAAYVLVGNSWEYFRDYTADASGRLHFDGDLNKTYKLVASKQGYYDAYTIIGRSLCSIKEEPEPSAIVAGNETAQEEKQPVPEEPSSVPENTLDVKKISVFYVILSFFTVSFLILVNYYYRSGRLLRGKRRTELRKIKRKILDFLGF